MKDHEWRWLHERLEKRCAAHAYRRAPEHIWGRDAQAELTQIGMVAAWMAREKWDPDNEFGASRLTYLTQVAFKAIDTARNEMSSSGMRIPATAKKGWFNNTASPEVAAAVTRAEGVPQPDPTIGPDEQAVMDEVATGGYTDEAQAVFADESRQTDDRSHEYAPAMLGDDEAEEAEHLDRDFYFGDEDEDSPPDLSARGRRAAAASDPEFGTPIEQAMAAGYSAVDPVGSDTHVEEMELHEAVFQLGGVERDVIEMIYFDDLPPDLVAEKLGVEPRSVRRIRERAEKNLKNLIELGPV